MDAMGFDLMFLIVAAGSFVGVGVFHLARLVLLRWSYRKLARQLRGEK